MKRRTFARFAGAYLVAAPMLSSAQQRRTPYRIGFLVPRVAPPPSISADPIAGSLLQALRELGYVDGGNIVIEWRWAGSRQDSLAQWAAELARLPVDVLLAGGPAGLGAAAAATRTIPIVMVAGSNDPVAEGYTQDLAHPTRNITGLAYAVSPERFQKELEYLKQAVPGISRVAVVWDLEDLSVFVRTIKGPLESAARNLGLAILPPVQIPDAASIDAAFAAIRAQRADALLILSAGNFAAYRERVAANAIAQRLPTVAAFRIMAEGGVLMSYGPDLAGMWRRSAYYVDRILKGAKPAELPIELPRSDELIINMKTARALGIAIPQSLLLRADAVIH